MDMLCSNINDTITTTLVGAIRTADNTLRKGILLCSRFMSVKPTGNLYFLTNTSIEYLTDYVIREHPDPTYEGDYRAHILDVIESQFNDHLRAGLFIMACCISPLELEEEQEVRLSSWLKEIKVMEWDGYDPRLDWSVFMGNHSSPLHPMMEANPPMAKVVHGAIDDWLQEITKDDKEYIPTISMKLLPSFTRRQMEAYVAYRMADPETFTQADMEYLMHRMGVVFEGGCEMAQRWYTHGISPRSYYVAGATAFNRSRFLKKIWQSLADHLVVTHRHNRVNPYRIHLPEDKACLFYDLTSFTSNLAVQRSFLESLATYVAGNEITLSDLEGSRRVDLESVIREYNTLNTYGEYRDARVWDSLTDPRHGVAGFLGVTGNIVTCSFIHGAVLLQLVEETTECGCAGDDAVIVTKDKESVWFCVSLIGILAVEKSFDLDEGAAVYLKRRTDYSPHRPGLQQRYYIQPPSLLFLMAKHNRAHLRRFREFFNSNEDLRDRSASSLQATFRSCARFSKERLEEVSGMLEWYYDRHGFPRSGQVPQFVTANARAPFIPSLSTLGSPEFVRETIENLFPGYAWLPPPASEEFVRVPLRKGYCIDTVSSERSRYLAKMGILEELRSRDVLYYGDAALNRLVELYTSRTKRRIRYRVTEDALSAFGDGTIDGILDYEWDPDEGSTTADVELPGYMPLVADDESSDGSTDNMD